MVDVDGLLSDYLGCAEGSMAQRECLGELLRGLVAQVQAGAESKPYGVDIALIRRQWLNPTMHEVVERFCKSPPPVTPLYVEAILSAVRRVIMSLVDEVERLRGSDAPL